MRSFRPRYLKWLSVSSHALNSTLPGAGVTTEQIKSVSLKAPIPIPVPVPTTLLRMNPSANVSDRLPEELPRIWAPATHVEDVDYVLIFSLAQFLPLILF